MYNMRIRYGVKSYFKNLYFFASLATARISVMRFCMARWARSSLRSEFDTACGSRAYWGAEKVSGTVLVLPSRITDRLSITVTALLTISAFHLSCYLRKRGMPTN